MRTATQLLPALLVLCSCSSPPKPPSVDPSTRRPVNAASAVELQTCKSDLQNTRILASETTRLAEAASATAVRLAQQQVTASGSDRTAPGNVVFTVHFAFASTEVKVPDPAAAALVEQARKAALVLARGRTDGSVETPAESRIARKRAAAVRAYLVQAGVDPARIRTTYQPVGDPAAENGTPQGRTLNRRVEIELYSVAPRALSLEPAQGL
jgi:outer membrane protein OmpA-like peptidoglycan-associated protein